MVALEEKIENGPSGDLWKPEPAIESEISGTVSVEETQDRLQRDFFENVSLFSSLFGITFSYLSMFGSPLLVTLGLPILEQAYGPSPDSVFIPCSNAIGQCVTLIIAGRTSDLVGRRWFVISGNALSMIGYMVAARANNLAVSIGGCFLIGIGAGLQQLTVMFALELVPFNRRYLTYGYIVSAWGPIISVSIGLVFTFLATAEESWRWLPYSAFIMSFFSLVFALVFYHPRRTLNNSLISSTNEDQSPVDYFGTLLIASSTVSFLLGIHLGGQRYPWSSARTIVPIALGAFGWILSLCWESYNRSLFRSEVTSFLKNRSYISLTSCFLLLSMCWTAPYMLWNQQIIAIYGGSSMLAGWYYNLVFAGPVLGYIIAGVMSTGFPRLKSQLVAGVVLVAAFAPALAAYTSTQLSVTVIMLMAAGTGVGIGEVICVVGATSVVDVREFGAAAGAFWIAKRIGTSIATAIYTEILADRVESNMLTTVVPVLVGAGLSPQDVQNSLQILSTGDSSNLAQIPGVTPALLEAVAHATREVFAHAFRTVYLISIAFGVSAIIAAIFASETGLAKYRTTAVVRKIEVRPSGVPYMHWLIFGESLVNGDFNRK